MLDKLFCNVGEKIKAFAKGSFIIEAIASVIWGISVLVAGGLGSELGLLIIISGP